MLGRNPQAWSKLEARMGCGGIVFPVFVPTSGPNVGPLNSIIILFSTFRTVISLPKERVVQTWLAYIPETKNKISLKQQVMHVKLSIHTKGAFTTPWLMVNQKFRNAINH